MTRKEIVIKDLPENDLKDPKDCHRIPFLEQFIGKRSIIKLKKGTIKGRLAYNDGWYYCLAPFKLVNDEWTQSFNRVVFRKGQIKTIQVVGLENPLGL